MSKISIRFFNDREVRAIWDEANSKWWFSAIDIIRAINKEDDYVMVQQNKLPPPYLRMDRQSGP